MWTKYLKIILKIGFPASLGLAFLLSGSTALAQNRPYLKSATLYISVKDWADIWLNGIPIVDSQPFTSESRGFQTIACIPRHLCYFQAENILAIENSDAYRQPKPQDDPVGVSYFLRLQLSDGREMTLSSNEVSDHKALYLPVRETMEPEGWHRLNFNDESWSPAFETGLKVPGLASMTDPKTRQSVEFLSASGNTPKAAYPGERHLFRRKFSLNLDPNPLCGSVGFGKDNVPYQQAHPPMKKAPNPKMDVLENSNVVHPPTPTSTPLSMFVPTVSATKTPPVFLISKEIPLSVLAPSPTTAPVGTLSVSIPDKSTRNMERQDFIGLWIKSTPTPTVPVNIQAAAESPTSAAPVQTPTASLNSMLQGPGLEQSTSRGETIVFDQPPANIYITFEDGPGIYHLEVLRASRQHVRNLFAQKIVAQKDGWVEWNGKSDTGQDMPAGAYIIVYSLDGRELKRITIIKGDWGNP